MDRGGRRGVVCHFPATGGRTRARVATQPQTDPSSLGQSDFCYKYNSLLGVKSVLLWGCSSNCKHTKDMDCSRLTYQERQLSGTTNFAQSTVITALAKTVYTLFTERYFNNTHDVQSLNMY